MAVEGWRVGVNDRGLNHFTYKAAFSTLTNVDFDGDRFVNLISETVRRRDELKARVKAASGQVDFGEGPAVFEPEATKDGMVARAKKSVSSPILISTQIILSLRELLIYGIKGDAGYADHAAILGKDDDAVYAFIHKAMA